MSARLLRDGFELALREMISEKRPVTIRDLIDAMELFVGTVYHFVHEEIGS